MLFLSIDYCNIYIYIYYYRKKTTLYDAVLFRGCGGVWGELLSEEYYSCFVFLESDHLTFKWVVMLYFS